MKINNREDNIMSAIARARGFTLIEIMVALAILSFTLAASLGAASSNARNASYLQNRTFAFYVAMNKMAEMDIFGKWPTPGGKERGSSMLADHEWYWTVEVTKSDTFDDIGVVTIEVRLSEDDENPVSSLVGAHAYTGWQVR